MTQSPFQSAVRRIAHPAYRSLETTVHPLRYLFLEITQKCNLRCLHCGSDCGTNSKLNELEINEWIEFINYLADNFPVKQVFLVITGGEPLCHPNLDKILEIIQKHGFRWGMVTNGFALDKKIIANLVNRDITSITVSIDGTRDSHDWLRGKAESFDRAYDGIKLLAQNNISFFDVVTCVNPRNITELPKVFDLLQKAGVRRWRIFSIFPKGRAKENSQLLLSQDQIKKLLDWISKTRVKLSSTDFKLDYSCEGFLPTNIDSAVRDEPYFCRAGISIGSVLGDGAIGACPNITRSLVQGNIRNDDFKQVWENRFEKFRDRNWMKTSECENCTHWTRCKGNSLHLWNEEENQTSYCYFNMLQSKK